MNDELMSYFNGDEMAADVWAGKYQVEGEITPADMHRRMASQFAIIEDSYNKEIPEEKLSQLSAYGRRRKSLSELDIFNLFDKFKWIVPQGSIMDILGNPNKIGSLSNCFVVGYAEDSYGGIFQKDQQLAQLMKRRGGVGVDISHLRPEGTKVTNSAGSSTGAISFMHRFSNTTREVAQKGRRGALMITIDCRHPDVEQFIRVKEDLTQVTGANISVKTRDDFMNAVDTDSDYILRFPVDTELDDLADLIPDFDLPYNELKKWETKDGQEVLLKRIKAKEIHDVLVHNAWQNAEPGEMYVDTHWNYSPDTVYPRFKGITSNPCGEIFMGKYDACRLFATNLLSFVTNPYSDTAIIDGERMYEIFYEQQVMGDNLIDLELNHINKIIQKIQSDPEEEEVKRTELELWHNIYDTAKAGRRTGCGFTALGDMLAAMGAKYDSERAKTIIDSMMRIKMQAELDATIDMSILRGSFEGWCVEKEFGQSNVACAAGNDITVLDPVEIGNDFYRMLVIEFPQQALRMMKYGRRNVSWSTVAPTGTVSIMTQTSSGLEPLFMPFYIRRKKVNPGENIRVDFTDQNGDTWQEYPVLHEQFKNWCVLHLKQKVDPNLDYKELVSHISKENLENLFELSPWFGSTANDINWQERVNIQGIIQKYTTHSISSTINLPRDVAEDEVREIYMQAWKKGLKGVTVYRDGSRSGVLVNESNKVEDFPYTEAPKRPNSLPAHYYYVVSQGRKYAVIVGLLQDKPYEVFAFENPQVEKDTEGELVKVGKKAYKFTSNNYTIQHLELSSDRKEEKMLTRFVSLLLRHGAKPKYVIEQTEKSDMEIVSFVKVICRVLKKYVPDEEVHGELCPECGSDAIVYEEGCKKCKSCGHSKC